MRRPSRGIQSSSASQPAIALDSKSGSLVRTYTAAQAMAMRAPNLTPEAPPKVLTELEAQLKSEWYDAKEAKRDIEREMIENLRQVRGEYDPAEAADIAAAGSVAIFMQITRKIKNAAVVLLDSVMNNQGDRSWTLTPTPIPDLPPDLKNRIAQRALLDLFRMVQQTQGQIQLGPDEIQQVMEMHGQRLRQMVEKMLEKTAEMRAKNMERRIADQFTEAGFPRTMRDFLDNLCTFHSGFLKGPIIRMKEVLEWMPSEGGFSPQEVERFVIEYEAPSPFDIFYTPECVGTQDGTGFHRQRMSRDYLYSLRTVDGFSSERVDQVIEEWKDGSRPGNWTDTTIDQSRADLEDKQTAENAKRNMLDVLECFTRIQGSKLKDWGVKNVPDEARQYDVTIWKAFDTVIGVKVKPYLLGQRPLSKASFENIPGSFWGRGVPAIVRDSQRMCNACARAICVNFGYASGPIGAIDEDALAPGEDGTIYPWKMLRFSLSESGRQQVPIQFFMPEKAIAELMAAYDRFLREADEQSGIPAYSYGSEKAAGAAKTKGGLFLLQENQSRGMNFVAANVDEAVRQLVYRQFTHNMVYINDPEIKGDIRVIARGAAAVAVKDQLWARRQAFLQLTLNPIDSRIVGPKERAELLRQGAATLDMNPEDVVPSDEEVEARFAVPEAQPGQDKKEPVPQGAA